MNDVETIRRLQTRMSKQQDEIRALRDLRAHTDRKLDKQRNELARMHQKIATLTREKAELLSDIRKLKEARLTTS